MKAFIITGGKLSTCAYIVKDEETAADFYMHNGNRFVESGVESEFTLARLERWAETNTSPYTSIVTMEIEDIVELDNFMQILGE